MPRYDPRFVVVEVLELIQQTVVNYTPPRWASKLCCSQRRTCAPFEYNTAGAQRYFHLSSFNRNTLSFSYMNEPSF